MGTGHLTCADKIEEDIKNKTNVPRVQMAAEIISGNLRTFEDECFMGGSV